jgi:ATP-dependent Clp protease protease subunit
MNLSDVVRSKPSREFPEVLVNEFSEDSAKKFRKQIFMLSKIDPLRPIIVHIDSFGGEVYSLLAMVDSIRSIPNPVYTVAIGKAMSCGAVLLAAGTKAFATPYSTIMIHEVSGGMIGHVQDLKVDLKETERLNSIIHEIMAKKCGKTAEQFKKIYASSIRDVHLDAKAALKLKLVDVIGRPHIKKTITYTVEVI